MTNPRSPEACEITHKLRRHVEVGALARGRGEEGLPEGSAVGSGSGLVLGLGFSDAGYFVGLECVSGFQGAGFVVEHSYRLHMEAHGLPEE